MAKEMQMTQNVVVHILSRLPKNDLETDLLNKIANNALFLANHQVEYLILDCSSQDWLLLNLSKIENFQKGQMKYCRLKPSSLKKIFVSATQISKAEYLFFVFNEVSLNEQNILAIEKKAPLLPRKDLGFFEKSVPENFNPKNFNLYMKKKKSFWEKFKLFFDAQFLM